MQNTTKVFVDLNVLKNEAKSIYKKNNKSLEYTKVLDIILSSLNFNSYNEYQRYFKTQVNTNDITDIHDIDIYELSLIENSLLSTLKKFNCTKTEKIFFLRNEINKRINEQIDFYPDLLLIQTLSVYRNISLDFIYLINNHKVDENILRNLIDYLLEKITTIQLNNFNLFSLYSICLKDPKEINKIKELIKNKKNQKNAIELKIFESALNNLISVYYKGKGNLFNLLYELYTSLNNSSKPYSQQNNSGQIKIDEKIEEIIYFINTDEIKYRNKLSYNNQNTDNVFIPYPIFNMSLDENLVLFFKKHTDFEKPLYLGEKNNSIFKKPLFFNNEESRENKFITGTTGCGKYEFILSILFQHIINNKSVIYFDYLFDMNTFHKLCDLSRIAGRSNDFCYFFENEDNLEAKILFAYRNNKIIFVFPRDPINKMHKPNIDKYYEFLGSVLKKIKTVYKTKSNGYLSDAIYFPSYAIHKSNLLHDNEFKLFLNTTNISIISSSTDFFELKDLDFLSTFKFHFVMKTDKLSLSKNYSHNNFDINILRHQELGEFTLFKYNGDEFSLVETGYRFKYLDMKVKKINTQIIKI